MTKEEYYALFTAALEKAAVNADEMLGSPVSRNFEVLLFDINYKGDGVNVEEAVNSLYLGLDTCYYVIDVGVRDVSSFITKIFVRPSGHPPLGYDRTWTSDKGERIFKQLFFQINVSPDRSSVVMRDIILNALAIFISRQQLVHEAMTELRPDLLAAAADTREERLKSIELAKIYGRVPQSGIWRDEWDHFIHGLGCRLINLNTQELIEWDAPDVDSFEEDWFLTWLIWDLRLNQRNTEANRELLRQAFRALVSDGTIREVKISSGIKYKVNSP
jgi:hypothetical protein